MESIGNMLASMRSLKSATMSAHSSRETYFKTLFADPYGLKNKDYDWRGENTFVYFALAVYSVGIATLLLLESKGYVPDINPNIYYAFLFAVFIELLGKVIFSWAIHRFKIKINYVRKLALRPWRKLKIYVITLFFIISGKDAVHIICMLFFLDQLKTIFTEWNVIRRRVPILAYAFVAWDRIEDRPYTLRYDMLEDILRFIVYLPFIILFGKASIIIMIPNLINEFGDGLAEPVGIRFGKHKYRTRSLWYKGKFWNGEFERSLEGSAMVYIISIVVLLAYQDLFTTTQLVVSLILLPVIMTIAEAFSPHTNDGPMLALTGCSFLWVTINYV